MMETLVPVSPHLPSAGAPLVADAARKLRVILADDDSLVRAAVSIICAHHNAFEILGEARNGDEAIELATRTNPDLLILDLNMPKRPGLSALNDLRAAVPKMKTILLTVSIERRQIVEALHAGARGIVLKEAAQAVLIDAVRSVLKGNFWVDRRPLQDVSQLIQELRSETKEAGIELTPREKQVVEYIVEGCTNKDIARTLCTSEQVIKNYLGKIFDKLGVFNRLELALYALDHNLANRP